MPVKVSFFLHGSILGKLLVIEQPKKGEVIFQKGATCLQRMCSWQIICSLNYPTASTMWQGDAFPAEGNFVKSWNGSFLIKKQEKACG